MQSVRRARAKAAQDLAEQFAGFRLLAAEADAVSRRRFERQVSHPRRLRDAPVESVTDARLLEVRMPRSSVNW